MSVLRLGGRRYVAGLFWLERGGAASAARNARAFGRPWHVHWGEQTGYAADEEDPAGCPSLAASLQAHIGAPFWMALVEATDGRIALVKARDGAILADGDEVFADRAAALEAFARSRDVGWALHATPGLVEGEVAELDPAALPSDRAMGLVAARWRGSACPGWGASWRWLRWWREPRFCGRSARPCGVWSPVRSLSQRRSRWRSIRR